MMPIISVYVDEMTAARMKAISAEKGRSVEDLAECAVSEAALNYFRLAPADSDPGRADGGANIITTHTNIAGT
ncbi:MAG: hypothetical protein E5X23_09755 [Mesorhizobium sp.]|uniref:hypothetical protein n=2 Tax=unclassified Mesorhizobium TaxID=325217 RepID=UPI000F759AC2|nr:MULTISPECIES: hypothetical protein [unclassified Mesorhizobium]AZO61721.1 hypothetical protein EJ078_22500 [Mesorhizobium sp. M1A.F.Ca.IN.022.06.1.1]MDF3178877.1 hypothetical protein [Mesorhizobium sp. P17.1]RUV26291.1 hypothetical protein EOA91_05170 [Mesorhizobium sp. M1A.F.Ca.IN.022.04.1.1]RUV63679.1 hypothetical protein EOA64_08275 [Mesorhizobium sp. M1A.F.Ca.IN.022.02.1.1]RWG09874.1 MAG: hypothetical protein EOQ53_21020 [Mesorhizobium sp.]